MNINMSNSPLNGSAMKRFSGASILNIRNIPGLKTAGEALGVDVTLSDEARAMLRELNAKRAVDTISDTIVSLIDSTDNAKANRLEHSDEVRLVAEYFYISNCTRLVSAFWGLNEKNEWDSNNGWRPCFGRMTATYADMVGELKARYSGEELNMQLKLLEADFNRAMESIAQSISSILVGRAFDGQELPDWLTELLDGDLIDMLNNIDFNSPSADDAVNAFINSVMAFMARIAESIQQSVLGSGTDSDTEEVKRSPSTS